MDVPNAGLDAAQNAIIVASTTYELSLHTADPGTTGSTAAASEGTDGRQPITFGASSAGVQTSTNNQTWSSPHGSQTYGYYGIWTNATTPVYLRGGQFSLAFIPSAGVPFTISAGGITFTAS